jgi:hypothetical protein
MKLYTHQGDVPIFIAEISPKKEQLRKAKKELVIKIGEITGHSHKVVAAEPRTKLYFTKDSSGGVYLCVVGGNAELRHEEHKTIVLPPQTYYFGSQIEYDPIVYRRQVLD